MLASCNCPGEKYNIGNTDMEIKFDTVKDEVKANRVAVEKKIFALRTNNKSKI